jgi:hypothetical protein
VILVRDAVCGSSDEGHDMLMRLYDDRFNEQIETADAEIDLVAVAVMITSLPDIRSSAGGTNARAPCST